MTDPPYRHPTAVLAWTTAGSCWVAQLFWPWTTSGLLSASSPAQAVRLVRSGLLDGVVPAWSAYALLVLPVAGLLLVALAGARAGAVRPVRRAVVAVGLVEVLAVAHALGIHAPARLGTGAWLALVGLLVAALASVLDRPRGARPSPCLEVRP